MDQKLSVTVDVKTCSPQQLVELSRQLKGSRHTALLLEVRKEMVERLRKAGASNQKIVDTIIVNMWKGDRANLITEWSEVLGISEQEFKRLANIR
jgi:hypothetical protein